ncbi:hypothetical protein BV898_04426 [Hypsibius exemplaris]|uniref:Sushi domain-containing protein n=1 Tax=Hypsibius exemplaris TaxID=2072580 RepID=A0A1W0X264_HYPEX|nr:hypothetical protein BV898_04426 [Hypsibius exemplaris]
METLPLFTALCLVILHAVTQADAVGSNVTTIGFCVFFGDKHTDCRGRLRCKPSDFRGTTSVYGDSADQEQQSDQLLQLPDLEQVCPGVDESSNGTWKVSQGIVPEQYAEIPYPGEVVATCYFRTNGTFHCIGGSVWPDTFWEGLFSGSLNSAFELGLDRWYFQHVERTTQPTTTPTTRRRAVTLTRSWVVAGGRDRSSDRERADDRERAEDRRRYGRPEDDVASANDNDDGYPARQQEPSSYADVTDEADNQDHQGISGTRDAVNRYDAQRAAAQGSDNEHITFTVDPQRVYVCEYYNNGQVGCRNCTEKVYRIVLETGENGNRRDYDCSQPRSGPILKRWTSDNGIIPSSPDSTAVTRSVVATCIFEKSARTYECHGDSALCPDEQGNRVHTNKCLGGRRWSGDYTGDFGYLS